MSYQAISDGIASHVVITPDEPNGQDTFKTYREAKRTLLRWLDNEVACLRYTQMEIRSAKVADLECVDEYGYKVSA